jgi:hypothetical protein
LRFRLNARSAKKSVEKEVNEKDLSAAFFRKESGGKSHVKRKQKLTWDAAHLYFHVVAAKLRPKS